VTEPPARAAVSGDLDGLLALYAAAEVSAFVEPRERAESIWAELTASPDVTVWIAPGAGIVLASCVLVTAPNLLRSGRRLGYLDNVVTHPDHRRRGRGAAVVRTALEAAWRRDCHHVLLQSGRADPGVHRFYERLGFVPGERTAYVARRPDGT
jgi:GNAT superfamily N-acetyltransferase